MDAIRERGKLGFRGLRLAACLACGVSLTGCAGLGMFSWPGSTANNEAAAAGAAPAGEGSEPKTKFTWFNLKRPGASTSSATPASASAEAPPPATAPATPAKPGAFGWLKPASWFDQSKAQKPADSMVLRGEQVESAAAKETGPAATDLAAAHELYRQESYSAAGKAFKK